MNRQESKYESNDREKSRNPSKGRVNTGSYIFPHHKSTSSLSAVGLSKLTNSKSISTLSPTMNCFTKLQTLKQFGKSNKLFGKGSSKGRFISKRKSGKSKNVSKGPEESRYKSSKNKTSNERLGFKVISKNNFLENNADIPHNSSLEEYNMKGKMSAKKAGGHRRKTVKNTTLTMAHHLSHFEDRSTSPVLKKSKYTKDKLKKLTTHLGTGSSRNNASKGILSNGSIPKTYKRSSKDFQKLEEKKKMKSTLDYRSNRRSSNKTEIEIKGSLGQPSDFGICHTTTNKDSLKKKSFDKSSKVKMMHMNNTNHLVSRKNNRCAVEKILNSGRKKGSSKIQQYKNFNAFLPGD